MEQSLQHLQRTAYHLRHLWDTPHASRYLQHIEHGGLQHTEHNLQRGMAWGDSEVG